MAGTGGGGGGRGIPPEAAGVAVLALHNLAVHRVLPAPADAALNLVTAAGLTAFARQAGCSDGDLGLRVQDAGRGLLAGLGAGAAAAGAVALGVALPATRHRFRDQRLAADGRALATYHAAVRIPLATALAEELLFRGALLALLRRRRSTAAAVAGSSLLFAAWHVLPAIDRHRAGPGADSRRGRLASVLGAMLTTGAAGYGFAWLRLRSRSLVAPVLAHAAVNASAYLAGRALARRP